MTAVGKRKLRLFIDGDDYTDAAGTVTIKEDDSDADFVTFAEAAAGGAKKYTLSIKAVQDTASTSLWYLAWGSAGSELEAIIWPYGKPTDGDETTAQPSVTGTVVITGPNGDLLGGEADKSQSARQSFECEWDFTAKPVLAITPPAP